MRRFAMTARLKPEKVDDYVRLHAEAWPQMRANLSAANIRNYSIWFDRRDLRLFQCFEHHGEDYDADCAQAFDNDVSHRWDALSGPCFAEPWTDLEEVFRHD